MVDLIEACLQDCVSIRYYCYGSVIEVKFDLLESAVVFTPIFNINIPFIHHMYEHALLIFSFIFLFNYFNSFVVVVLLRYNSLFEGLVASCSCVMHAIYVFNSINKDCLTNLKYNVDDLLLDIERKKDMYSYENLPPEWFTSSKRPRSYHYPPAMSRPISKSFNRISDFIFPDTVHVCFHQQRQYPSVYRRYQRNENYSLPVLNRHHHDQPDLIVVERLPPEELANVDFLYHEQYQKQPQQRYQPIRRRYSSIVDQRRAPFNERTTTGLVYRPDAHRERIRNRRKRHTTDNAYHSMMKSILDEEEAQYSNDDGGPNYILSYTTTLDPITDSESMTSVNQQQYTNYTSLEKYKQQAHSRVPINGTIPIMAEREYKKQQQQHSSSSSTRDSSSDTDITERHPATMNYTHYQQDSSVSSVSLCK